MFQDLRMGRKIGGGIEKNDLYILVPGLKESEVLQSTVEGMDNFVVASPP